MGVDGARRAQGTVVVIDVLRSFTVSAYALAGGASECRLVPTTAEARALAANTSGAVLSVEEGGLPVEGIAISNSPTMIQAAELNDRVLVQRSSQGTVVVAAVPAGHDIFAASLVVARSTVEACMSSDPATITLVASGDFPEDHACARYMEAVCRGESTSLDEWLRPLRESERYRSVRSGTWPGFPPGDLDLALIPDRFGFAMPVSVEARYHRLTRRDRPSPAS